MDSDTQEPLDDPREIIQTFLTVVTSLHEKVNQGQERSDGIATARSVPNLTSAELTSSGSTTDPVRAVTRLRSVPILNGNIKVTEDHQIPKLQRNLVLLKEDVHKLQLLRIEVADEVSNQIGPLQGLLNKATTELTRGMKKDLNNINKKIFNLMVQVPLLPNKPKKAGGSDSDDGDVINTGKGIICLPAIHANEEDLKRLALFRDVKEKFKGLGDDKRRMCLLSFAVFPENQEVNRTMLMYWWIGEGILDVQGAEDKVKEILSDFVEQKLIEPVANKRKVELTSYKMTPFVHASVVHLSVEMKLFDTYQKGEKPIMKKSQLNKVCLVEGSSSQQEAKATKMPGVVDIETVFNVSERFPDFTFKWFAKSQPSGKKTFRPLSKTTYKKTSYKALKVLYLGRWERTAKRHIEVENPELMKNLKYMTKLKLLSFQGISRIERLDDAVCELDELIILDLRACYNLEKLPEKIDSLTALIYLDITDCYMIDRMPKKLSWLDNLEVLKGFVVSDAIDDETVCLLGELKYLKKLRKLSISINKENFGIVDVFVAVKNFGKLEKLKVAWGGINKHEKGIDAQEIGLIQRTASKILGDKKTKVPEIPALPSTLKKLDLQCYPGEDLPKWLQPGSLLNLEKLYIKGGIKLASFGDLPNKPTECGVEVLRLKFLPRLKVEWRELRELYFPKLKFLDKYQCPQVSFCPTDGIGIWRQAANNV